MLNRYTTGPRNEFITEYNESLPDVKLALSWSFDVILWFALAKS